MTSKTLETPSERLQGIADRLKPTSDNVEDDSTTILGALNDLKTEMEAIDKLDSSETIILDDQLKVLQDIVFPLAEKNMEHAADSLTKINDVRSELAALRQAVQNEEKKAEETTTGNEPTFLQTYIVEPLNTWVIDPVKKLLVSVGFMKAADGTTKGTTLLHIKKFGLFLASNIPGIGYIVDLSEAQNAINNELYFVQSVNKVEETIAVLNKTRGPDAQIAVGLGDMAEFGDNGFFGDPKMPLSTMGGNIRKMAKAPGAFPITWESIKNAAGTAPAQQPAAAQAPPAVPGVEAAPALPVTQITFEKFQNPGAEIPGFGTVKVVPPNKVEVNGNKWILQGKSGSNADGAKLSIKDAQWTGTNLIFDVHAKRDGNFLKWIWPIDNNYSHTISNDDARKLLWHLATGNGVYPIGDEGAEFVPVTS